jgi:hypothetical protein
MIGRAGAAVWEFLVGDDGWLALGAVVAIGATAVLVAVGVNAWWCAPVVVVIALARSLRRAVPQTERGVERDAM